MPTDPNHIHTLFLAALELPPERRAEFLTQRCGSDADLRAAVEELLAAHAEPTRGTEPPGPGPTDATGTYEPGATGAFAPGATGAYLPDAATATFGGPAPPPERADTHSGGGPAASGWSVRAGSGDPEAPAGEVVLGKVIAGRYTLLSVIGEGGMGSVYLAEQTEPVKRQVALKLIKAGMDSRGVLARFDAERQALALMDHPNIARVYDGGTTPAGQPFFVMELVKGVPLTDYCDGHHLSVPARLELFVSVCQAVQHAHQKGIIHRDLKPSNVLVTEVDGRPTPKVIDFGVAKATEQKLTDLSFADTGAIVGTPAYMSPEQADPSSMDIDTRTDVYALGVMLYELLTGSPPIDKSQFKRGAILEMLRMVREVDPPRPSTRLSGADALPNIAANRSTEPARLAKLLRGELDWVVMKALEKDRTRRYDSANGLARDLQRYLADEVVEARPPSRAYRLKKFVRRNRGAVVASALVALALVAGVVGISWQWREAVYQRNRAEGARAEAETSAGVAREERAEAVHQRTRAEGARAEAETSSRVAQQQRKVALEAVGRMVTTVRTELVKKPDLQGVLKTVLEIAQSSLDNIARNPLVDISLNDTTRAAAHDATARLYRDLGNTPAALKEFTTAADIYRAILDRAADGADKEVVKKNLLIALISLGQTSLRTGSQADARGYYERAAELVGRLDNKTAADFRRILIDLYLSMGVVTIDRRPREARENYLGALRVAEELARQEAAGPGGPADGTRLALQQLYFSLGSAEGRLRDPKAQEQYLGKARTIAEERLKAQPDDNARKKWLAFARERTGDALLRANKPADAAREFAAAAPLLSAIAVSDPKNVDAQADLARVLYSQGLAAVRTGDKAAAAKYFQGSLDIRKNRINLDTETYAQRDVMMSLAQVGNHREALEWAERVRAKLPKDPGALVDIANCYAVCSTVLPAGGVEKEIHERYVTGALDALKQAIDAGYGDKVNLETEPDLDGIRNRAEFKVLVNRVPEP